jgi:hypothetical protein
MLAKTFKEGFIRTLTVADEEDLPDKRLSAVTFIW